MDLKISLLGNKNKNENENENEAHLIKLELQFGAL